MEIVDRQWPPSRGLHSVRLAPGIVAANETAHPVHLFGESSSAVLALYAALLEPEVAGLVLLEPVSTHMSDSAPSLLNVLRVCDIPDVLGMLAPRPVKIVTEHSESFQKATAMYRAAGATEKLVLRPLTQPVGAVRSFCIG